MIETGEATPTGVASGSFRTTLDGVPVTVSVILQSNPVPLPVSTLSALSVPSGMTLFTLMVGQSAVATLTRTAPYTSEMVVSVTGVGVTAPAQVTIPGGALSAAFTYTGAFAGPGSLTATGGGVTRSQSFTVSPVPVPVPTRLNVRDYGAVGDGIANDQPAIQKAIDAAGTSGLEVYVPAGNYLLASGLAIMKGGLVMSGDGDTSRLIHGLRQGMHIGGAGAVVSTVAVTKLCFYGAPGKFNGDGNNAAHAILVDGATGVTVEDVLFVGPAHAVYQTGSANGVLVNRCRVTGYGRVAFGLGDGATVRDTVIAQNYPDPTARGMDYAFYVHNSARNVLIERCNVSGCGGYGFHLWAQAVVGPGGPVTLQSCNFTDCAIGAIVANSPSTAGRVQGLTMRGNSWVGPVRGTCVVIRQGDGIIFENNTIRSGKQAVEMIDCTGLSVGLWGPNDPAGLITNAVFRNNVVDGWDYPIFCRDSNGGTFVAVTMGPNQVTNCRHAVIAEGRSGLTVVT